MSRQQPIYHNQARDYGWYEPLPPHYAPSRPRRHKSARRRPRPEWVVPPAAPEVYDDYEPPTRQARRHPRPATGYGEEAPRRYYQSASPPRRHHGERWGEGRRERERQQQGDWAEPRGRTSRTGGGGRRGWQYPGGDVHDGYAARGYETGHDGYAARGYETGHGGHVARWHDERGHDGYPPRGHDERAHDQRGHASRRHPPLHRARSHGPSAPPPAPHPRGRATAPPPSSSQRRNASAPATKRMAQLFAHPLVKAGARTAFSAGAQAAIKSSSDSGPWLGPKGAKVATAALGAALVDGFMQQKHPGSMRQDMLRQGVAAVMGEAERRAARGQVSRGAAATTGGGGGSTKRHHHH